MTEAVVIYQMTRAGWWYAGKTVVVPRSVHLRVGDRGFGAIPGGYKGSGLAWGNVIRKHGVEGMRWRIVDIVPLAEAKEAESYWIDRTRYRAGKRCVNIADGGQGGNQGEAWAARQRAAMVKVHADSAFQARRRKASASPKNRANVSARIALAFNPRLDADALAEAAASRREQNGVMEPLPGTVRGRVWAITGRLKDELGREPRYSEALRAAEAEGIGSGTAAPAFRDWRRFHSPALPKAPGGKTAAICLRIMDREGREPRFGEYRQEALAEGMSRADAAFYGWLNWWRLASPEDRERHREEGENPEAAEAQARAEALAAGRPVALIHSTCDQLAAKGIEPTAAMIRAALPDLNPGTVKQRLTRWRKARAAALALAEAA